jgi:hypothetical protein
MELFDYVLSDGRKLTRAELSRAFSIFRRGTIAEIFIERFQVSTKEALIFAEEVINKLNNFDYFDGSSPEEKAIEQVVEDYNLKEREGN